MTSVLGIKMTHAPVLSIIVMILIVTMQLVNKFLFTDKDKPNVLLTLRKQSHELAATMPFFQAGAIDMYAVKTYTLDFPDGKEFSSYGDARRFYFSNQPPYSGIEDRMKNLVKVSKIA
jgi:hypothetical protein